MSDTYEATALFLRQRVLILQARLAEAEALLRVMPGYGLSAYDKERWEKARNAFLAPDSAPAAREDT